MPQDEKVNVALPADLSRQFAALRQRLFSLESLFAASLGFSALLLSYFILFVSDRFWNTPVWLRVLVLVLAVVGVGVAAAWWAAKWIWKPRDLRSLSLLVQRKYRRLGDRLLGIVELTEEKSRPAYFSPELYAAAIEQVSSESAKYDFSAAVNQVRTQRQLLITGGLLIMALVPALLLPRAGWNAFCRWILPLSSIPRFTLVEIEQLPTEQIVPHGEKVTLSGHVQFHSFWHPEKIRAEVPGQPIIFARAENEQFTIDLPGQVQDGKLRVRVGDAEKIVDLKARHRPGIKSAIATLELPSYLQYPPEKQNVQGGVLNALEGSTVAIEAETSRELSEANVSFDNAKPERLKISGVKFSTPRFPVDGLSAVSIGWCDQVGLTNANPWRLAFQVQKDQAPQPDIPDMYRDTAILETEVLPIVARARDDYGVKSLGLTWSLDNAETLTNAPVQTEFAFNSSSNNATVLEQTFNFSPAVLRIPAESTITMQAFAIDFLPGRERVQGPIYRIHVMGNAQHAEMIRQNLESLLVHLEEVSRLEEKITSDTREMKELQKLDTPEAAKKAAELEQDQERNAAQLQEIASEGMKTLREALRNPAFNEQTLMKWTKDLHQMQKLAQEQMKEAARSLKEASQQPSSPQEQNQNAQAQNEKQQQGQEGQQGQPQNAQSPAAKQREDKLAEALKKEQEVVDSLRKMQKQVNEGLDELQALTLAQRLRQVGASEKKIEGHLQSAIPDTIGLNPGELPLRYQKANSQLAGIQSETQSSSTKLLGEISRFYERTQKPNYGEVSKAMKEARASEELDRLRVLIQDNIGMEAMQNLATWSEKFNSWADTLEPKGEDGSSGSGSGQSGPQTEDDAALKQLLGLLRMREKQVNIQGRTQLLNQYASEEETYKDGAVLLSASQAKLNRDMTKQATGNRMAMLEAPYSDTVNSMMDVETLLDKPRTDEVTMQAQNKSLANITDLINILNEEAKKQNNNNSSSSASSGESSSEQMAFLMQMMAPQMSPGMQSGQSPGANQSGGTTDKASSALTGDASGKSEESRSVKKSSGLPQNYPTEFRQALENYFKAIESKGGK